MTDPDVCSGHGECVFISSVCACACEEGYSGGADFLGQTNDCQTNKHIVLVLWAISFTLQGCVSLDAAKTLARMLMQRSSSAIKSKTPHLTLLLYLTGSVLHAAVSAIKILNNDAASSDVIGQHLRITLLYSIGLLFLVTGQVCHVGMWRFVSKNVENRLHVMTAIGFKRFVLKSTPTLSVLVAAALGAILLGSDGSHEMSITFYVIQGLAALAFSLYERTTAGQLKSLLRRTTVREPAEISRISGGGVSSMARRSSHRVSILQQGLNRYITVQSVGYIIVGVFCLIAAGWPLLRTFGSYTAPIITQFRSIIVLALLKLFPKGSNTSQVVPVTQVSRKTTVSRMHKSHLREVPSGDFHSDMGSGNYPVHTPPSPQAPIHILHDGLDPEPAATENADDQEEGDTAISEGPAPDGIEDAHEASEDADVSEREQTEIIESELTEQSQQPNNQLLQASIAMRRTEEVDGVPAPVSEIATTLPSEVRGSHSGQSVCSRSEERDNRPQSDEECDDANGPLPGQINCTDDDDVPIDKRDVPCSYSINSLYRVQLPPISFTRPAAPTASGSQEEPTTYAENSGELTDIVPQS